MSFVALSNITLAATQTSISFTSISQSYRDLYMVITQVGVTGTGGRPLVKVNNDAGVNYSGLSLRTNGTSFLTSSNLNGQDNGATLAINVTNGGGNDVFYDIWITDYSTTDKYKNLLSKANSGSSGNEIVVNTWKNTSAVTSLVLYFTSGLTFGIGTTVTLYGVLA
jgi:hypothetical protein